MKLTYAKNGKMLEYFYAGKLIARLVEETGSPDEHREIVVKILCRTWPKTVFSWDAKKLWTDRVEVDRDGKPYGVQA